MAKHEKKDPSKSSTFGGGDDAKKDGATEQVPPVETTEETPSVEDLQGIIENQAEVIKDLNQDVADITQLRDDAVLEVTALKNTIDDLEEAADNAPPPALTKSLAASEKPQRKTMAEKCKDAIREVSRKHGDPACHAIFAACGSNAKYLKKVDSKLYPEILKMAEERVCD